MRCEWQGLALGLVMALAVQAGEQRTRNVVVQPNKPLDDVQLQLRIDATGAGGSQSAVAGADRPDLRVGSRLRVCFSASQDGYVSLWSRDAEGKVPQRIYPNEYAPETEKERGKAIEGGVEVCVGRQDDGFKFVVARPLGEADIYLHYTPDIEDQLGDDAYPEISFSTRGVDDPTYGSKFLEYEVVE